MLPPILHDLKGKTFLFKIGIEKDNFVYKHDTFKVLNIITNPGMITEYEATQTPTVKFCSIVVLLIFGNHLWTISLKF